MAAKRPLRDCACGEKGTVMDTRRIRYTVRLTEQENISIEREMELLGYRSVAKYFRIMSLKKHHMTKSGEKDADSCVMEKLTRLRTDLNKLGANYNQIVKRYNAIARECVSRNYIPASLYSLGFHTQKLEELTLGMIKLFIRMENEISKGRESPGTDENMFNK